MDVSQAIVSPFESALIAASCCGLIIDMWLSGMFATTAFSAKARKALLRISMSLSLYKRESYSKELT